MTRAATGSVFKGISIRVAGGTFISGTQLYVNIFIFENALIIIINHVRQALKKIV